MATRVHVNNYTSTLNGSITNVATSVVVTSGSALPSSYPPDVFLTISGGGNIEIVKVTARTSNTLTVVRGQQGTSGTAFSSGALISCRVTADSVDRKIDTAGGTAAGTLLVSDGTNYVASTPTFPNASATSGKIIKSNGTNWVASTETYAAPGTSGNVLTSDGTNWTSATPSTGGIVSMALGGTNANLTASNGGIFYSTGSAGAILSGTATARKMLLSQSSTAPIWSTETIAAAAGNTNRPLVSDGTNLVFSNPSYPTAASPASGKIIVSDGTNFITSTPTFPNASATSGKIIKSDGTNWVASTETYAAPGTSGNVMTSNGTNWTSAAAPSGDWAKITQVSVTIGGGPQASISFTGLSNTTYTSYIFVIDYIIPSTDADVLWLRVSTDGGSTYINSAGAYHYNFHTATSGATLANTSSTSATELALTWALDSSLYSGGTVEYVNAADTSRKGEFLTRFFGVHSDGTTLYTLAGGGSAPGTTSVNAVRFLMSTGNIQLGRITMYGRKQ